MPDRIFAGKNFLCGFCIDDGDERRALRVVLIEIAAAHERDAHRLEIIGCRDANISPLLLFVAGTIKGARAIAAGEREAAHCGDMLNARHRRYALHDLLVKLELLILVGSR